jgi:hypothetical protein
VEPLLSSILLLSALLGGFPVVPPPAPVTPAGCVGMLCLAAHPAERRDLPVFRIAQAPPPKIAPPQGDGRACPGCPKRRLGAAFLQTTIINGFYELANLIRGQDTAKITPSTWWLNMKRGWEWDLDDFVVNQIGHPYQGNNYYTSGRANGLNFWESSALTAFGSSTWEYFGETNQASLNDFINTTLGGIALGEMFHRTAWLMRNTQKTGKPRLWSEIGATVVDPIGGINRFLSGDSARVVEKPRDMVPSALGATVAAGALWRGSNTETINSSAFGFLETEVLYGDPTTGRSRTPYDAFGVRLDIGGGSALSEARVRGRLIGQPYKGGAVQLNVAQGYQFNSNSAYRFGAQSFEANLSFVKDLSSTVSMWAAGWGGVTVLGAVDSLPPGTTPGEIPEEEEPDPDAGQGVSTGPRFYDYGPGTNFGGLFFLRHGRRPFLMFSYEAHHLYVVDGVRANHLLQRGRLDLRAPLKGPLGIGGTIEFFDRRTYYQTPGVSSAQYRFPQYRLYLTWSAS